MTKTPATRPPSVERVLAAARPRLDRALAREAVLAAAREVVDDERTRLGAGEAARSTAALGEALVERLEALASPAGSGLIPAINATGVILHTNLGRAPWPRAAIEAAALAAAGHSLLELDRPTGRRGARFRAAEEHLVALTGAEDALVTNNNAAALCLAVGLARRGGVAVSRGELLEIGGGVRIPEIVRRAGARLVEVGTTNRTRAADYEEPLAEGRAALVLRVHRSNFRQQGFVEEPAAAELAALANARGVPLVDDLGSGALLDTAAFGLAHEPTPRQSLAAGADLVTFSGDKLVGGPQAGLMVGRADLVARLRRDPLARAMRPDKVTLAAMAATLSIYRAGRAVLDIPVWRSLATPMPRLRERAGAIRAGLGSAVPGLEVVESEATLGGGALPGETLPSVALRVPHASPGRLVALLRQTDPAVVGRVEKSAVLLDLRAVDEKDDADLARALAAAAGADAGERAGADGVPEDDAGTDALRGR